MATTTSHLKRALFWSAHQKPWGSERNRPGKWEGVKRAPDQGKQACWDTIATRGHWCHIRTRPPPDNATNTSSITAHPLLDLALDTQDPETLCPSVTTPTSRACVGFFPLSGDTPAPIPQPEGDQECLFMCVTGGGQVWSLDLQAGCKTPTISEGFANISWNLKCTELVFLISQSPICCRKEHILSGEAIRGSRCTEK